MTTFQKALGGLAAVFVMAIIGIISDHSSPARSMTGIGSTAVVASGDGGKDIAWTCAPTQDALDQVINWEVRHDAAEI